MAPRPRPTALPARTAPRHGRGRGRRAAPEHVRRHGDPAGRRAPLRGPATALTVAALAFTGGVGAGAAINGGQGGPGGGAVPALVGRVVPGDTEAQGSGGQGDAAAVASQDRVRTGGAALDAPVTAVGVASQPRPLPLPQLVARDTVGPLWLTPQDRQAGLLALDVPHSASGVLDVVPGSEPAPTAAPVRSVRVEVERGLPVDGATFAASVMATLNDPRGWGARGEVSFARTDGPADVRVVLASPALVDALCAPLPTGGEVSCGRNGHAALNFRRWVHATPEFADRTQYRQYLVNHEVGHLLGHQHEDCPGPGRLAPLMQQQSLGVAPCVPNGWPFPQG